LSLVCAKDFAEFAEKALFDVTCVDEPHKIDAGTTVIETVVPVWRVSCKGERISEIESQFRSYCKEERLEWRKVLSIPYLQLFDVDWEVKT